MTMLLVPMLLLSAIIAWVIGNQVPAMIQENSTSLFSVSSLSLDTLFKELLQPKIYIEANPEIHLSLLQYLQDTNVDEKTQANMVRLNQYLDTTRFSRNYIHSIYIAKQGAPFMLVNGTRMLTSHVQDSSWWNTYEDHSSENFMIFKRNLKNYSFETEGTPVITLIYTTKYHELLVINLFQSYFSHFLDSLVQHDGEAIWVTDAQGNILAENWVASGIPDETKYKAYNQVNGNNTFENAYQLTRRQLDNKELILYSLIPKDILNSSTTLVLHFTLIAAGIAILVSLILSFIFTRKSFHQINKIVSLFEQDIPYPLNLEIRGNQRDPFYYILKHVASLYVDQAHLHADLLQHSYNLIHTRLAALQYQINPHFIFNTLQVIDMQIGKDLEHPVLANKMIQQFSKLLRYSLEDPTTLVPITQEIEMTKTFLQLVHYRNTNRIQIIWFYEEEKLQSVNTIRMLFQPLLENVITHAINEDSSKPVQVRIRLTPKDDYVHCSIVDNGCGISYERLVNLRKQFENNNINLSHEIGLVNVYTRLLLSFDESCTLKVYSRPKHGFAIFFRIPYALPLVDMRMGNDTF